MALTNARIEQVEGHSVVIADMPKTTLLGYYSGLNAIGKKWTEIAIVCATPEKAEAVMAKANEYEIGQEFTVRRGQAFPGVAKALKGRGIIFDRHGPVDDDAAIKRVLPPPEGIEVRFRWDPAEQIHRLDAFTEKNGTVVTRTVVLPPADKAFREDVEKAYARFVRTSPAPKGRRRMQCGTHTAALISRLETPAAACFRQWLTSLESTPLHMRGSHAALVLPGRAIDQAMISLTLTGVRGRDEIEAAIVYKGGHSLRGGTLTVAQDLPATVVAALPGRRAIDVLGADELSDVKVTAHTETQNMSDGTKRHLFDIEMPKTEIPTPVGVAPDEERARRVIERNYSGYGYQAVLTRTLTTIAPSTLLHLIRTMKLHPEKIADLTFIKDADVSKIRLQGETIIVEEPRMARISDILGDATNLAA